MPNKPLKISRPWVTERKAYARNNDHSKFYKTWKWRKFSEQFREKYPLCKHCADEGITTAARDCDHIEGLDNIIKEGGDPLSEIECQSLCRQCHDKKSGKEAHGYREENSKKIEKKGDMG